MSLSIIVPMLNEAAALPPLLARLRPELRRGAEVILVDGGSSDGSPDQARQAGFRVLRSARGRAVQMNAGAAAARGTTLLFLHADTILPTTAAAHIEAALCAPMGVWGRFDVCITGRHPLLAWVAFLMNWRSRLSGIATGDQAIFVRRAAFETVGGFPIQALMEDIELSRRLRRLAWPCCLRTRVTTSGRRWETRGVWRTVFLMWSLRLRYWLGTPAEVLARSYR